MRTSQKLYSGFTIVELIVCIVVIAILATITYLAYEDYERNAQGAQVSSAVSSYRSAIETGVTLETDTTPSESYNQDEDFLAACITSNTERCCFYYHLDQAVECENNAELKADGKLDTDFTYDIIQKYVSDKKAQMPKFSNFGTLNPCTSKVNSWLTYAPPCYSNQIAYTTGQLTTNDQGYLHYYLPSSFSSCGSDKVLSYDIGFPQLKGAPYTKRETTAGGPQYTYCLILVGTE